MRALLTHTVGVDLGQSQDYTAVAVLEEAYYANEALAWHFCLPAAGWVWPSQLPSLKVIDEMRSSNYHHGRPANPPVALRYLERFELGTPYPKMVEKIGKLLVQPPLQPDLLALVVDGTGVGAPVVDMFDQAGLQPIPITITAGFTVHHEQGTRAYRVPKRDLVSTMSVLLEQRRLRIPKELPLADLLTKELQEFKRKMTPAGSDSYAAGREGKHDDLVLAVALAAWYREYMNALIEQQNARTHAPAAMAG